MAGCVGFTNEVRDEKKGGDITDDARPAQQGGDIADKGSPL